jgi:hypothetical protein
MDSEDIKLSEQQKQLVKAGVKEFMDQVYRNVGRGIVERVFWAVMGALLYAFFGGHLPK